MSDIRYIADKLYESKDEYILKRNASLSVNAAVTGCESKETMEALATVLVNIHHVPFADVAPVVHGRWNPYHRKNALGAVIEGYQCSKCGEGISYNEWGDYYFSDYCPNCGAKMDESEDNNV